MAVSSAGLRPKNDCSGKVQKQFTVNYRPVLSSERALQNNKPGKKISRRKKNWSRVPDGRLTPRKTGRLTVGHKLTSTSKLSWLSWLQSNYSHCSHCTAMRESMRKETDFDYDPCKIIRHTFCPHFFLSLLYQACDQISSESDWYYGSDKQLVEILGRGSARWKAATYTAQNTHTHTHRITAARHPCLEWDSNQSCLHSSVTVNGVFTLKSLLFLIKVLCHNLEGRRFDSRSGH
jgi:hypothetical protein